MLLHFTRVMPGEVPVTCANESECKKENQGRIWGALHAAGAYCDGGDVLPCGRQKRHSNCNNFSPIIRRPSRFSGGDGGGAEARTTCRRAVCGFSNVLHQRQTGKFWDKTWSLICIPRGGEFPMLKNLTFLPLCWTCRVEIRT